jgi:hypothetical protein
MLSPYLDEEWFYENNLEADGTKITQIGFSYLYPKLNVETLTPIFKEIVDNGTLPSFE